MNFEYYYGTQADQFSFIRIPRILLLDEAFSALSLSAKVLYSVLLDRMGLSMKNKWLDEENKVYIIYQITEIQSDLGFSKKKAMDYLTELEKIGLIEKKKRGFGLPNIIYVKSFMAHQSSQRSNEMGTSQEKDAVHRSIEIGTSEVRNKHLRGAETDTSEVPKNGLQEVPKTVPLYNKTYMNYNNQSNMKANHIKSDGDRIRCDQKEQEINAYAELVKKNIDFDNLYLIYDENGELDELNHDGRVYSGSYLSEDEWSHYQSDNYPSDDNALCYVMTEALTGDDTGHVNGAYFDAPKVFICEGKIIAECD